MAHVENYLPPRFADIREFMDFCLAENPEFDNMEETRKKWLKNKFPTEADLDGIKIFEEILEITPAEGETLEDRRFRVISKLNQRLPYTWAQLYKMMDAICGKGNYELKIEHFVLMLYLAMDSQSKLRSVMDMLRDVVPMHILLDITQLLYYNFGIDIYSYRRRNVDLTILPRQEREVECKNTINAVSGVMINGSLTIQCQKI